MSDDAILRAAKAAPAKAGLEPHREAIALLRTKGYSWREIAQFFADRGPTTDHATLYRFMTRTQPTVTIPSATEYERALTSIQITEAQRAMLERHYRAHNRTITYTQLSEGADFDGVHQGANLQYGNLGKALGRAVGFTFAPAKNRPDDLFYSSAIGMENQWPHGKEFELVMHHELAKALDSLGWFK